MFTHCCLCYLLKSLEKSIPHLIQVCQFRTFLFGKHWSSFVFLNGPKIDTAVLFDNSAHFYFLVHRKPYYTKTLLINSLTFAEWAEWIKDAFCSFVNCSTERPKEGGHHIFVWSHKKQITFPNAFVLNYFKVV